MRYSSEVMTACYLINLGAKDPGLYLKANGECLGLNNFLQLPKSNTQSKTA